MVKVKIFKVMLGVRALDEEEQAIDFEKIRHVIDYFSVLDQSLEGLDPERFSMVTEDILLFSRLHGIEWEKVFYGNANPMSDEAIELFNGLIVEAKSADTHMDGFIKDGPVMSLNDETMAELTKASISELDEYREKAANLVRSFTDEIISNTLELKLINDEDEERSFNVMLQEFNKREGKLNQAMIIRAVHFVIDDVDNHYGVNVPETVNELKNGAKLEDRKLESKLNQLFNHKNMRLFEWGYTDYVEVAKGAIVIGWIMSKFPNFKASQILDLWFAALDGLIEIPELEEYL